jgi:hypothetical protein
VASACAELREGREFLVSRAGPLGSDWWVRGGGQGGVIHSLRCRLGYKVGVLIYPLAPTTKLRAKGWRAYTDATAWYPLIPDSTVHRSKGIGNGGCAHFTSQKISRVARVGHSKLAAVGHHASLHRGRSGLAGCLAGKGPGPARERLSSLDGSMSGGEPWSPCSATLGCEQTLVSVSATFKSDASMDGLHVHARCWVLGVETWKRMEAMWRAWGRRSETDQPNMELPMELERPCHRRTHRRSIWLTAAEAARCGPFSGSCLHLGSWDISVGMYVHTSTAYCVHKSTALTLSSRSWT